MTGILRKFWQGYFNFDWKFGVILILLMGIPRFILVLRANITGNYAVASIVFAVMWFIPFIFLTKQGRKEIGFKRPNQYIQLFYSFVMGTLLCALIFGLFLWLYDTSVNHPFVYISRSGAGSMASTLSSSERLTYFLIATIPSLFFSPIGEEFLYRGVVHGSFVARFGERKASVFDSLAFAFTHLAHFGIIYNAGAWDFLPIPAFLWVAAMFMVSQLFFQCKLMTGSILGAIFSHAGFNFAMMYFIFYHLL